MKHQLSGSYLWNPVTFAFIPLTIETGMLCHYFKFADNWGEINIIMKSLLDYILIGDKSIQLWYFLCHTEVFYCADETSQINKTVKSMKSYVPNSISQKK